MKMTMDWCVRNYFAPKRILGTGRTVKTTKVERGMRSLVVPIKWFAVFKQIITLIGATTLGFGIIPLSVAIYRISNIFWAAIMTDAEIESQAKFPWL